MKAVLSTILFILSISFSFAQNFYKTYSKPEYFSLLSSIDNDSLLNKITVKDSLVKGELYLKYSLTGYYKDGKVSKIELNFDSKLGLIKEVYYFDSQEFLIYTLIEEYKYDILIFEFEVQLYGKDKILFIFDGFQTTLKDEESKNALKLIKEDIKYYKELLKKK